MLGMVHVVLAGVGTAILLALCYFVFVATFNASRLWEHPLEARVGPLPRFVGVAVGVGVLVCVYAGAEKLLLWIPKTVGGVNEDGEFQPLRDSLTLGIAIFVGGPLAAMLLGAPRSRALLALRQEEAEELARILETRSPWSLAALCAGYRAKRDEARSLLPKRPRGLAAGLLPSDLRVEMFEFLIQRAEAQRDFLEQRAAPN